MKVISLEQMANKEYTKDKCVYKRANAFAYDGCYICDGFDYNCPSYQIQQTAKEIHEIIQKEDEDLMLVSDLDND